MNDSRLASYVEKPEPKFDWSELDDAYSPALPPGAICRKDLIKHYREKFGIKERRVDQLTVDAVQQGLLKPVPGRRGWYVKP